MTSTHSQLEIYWSNLSAALMETLDNAGCSMEFKELILCLCRYGREVFTWWNSRRHTMSFTNRGNGKSICNCLDKRVLEGLHFMEQLPNAEHYTIVPDCAIQIINVWDQVLNQIKVTEPLEEALEEFPDGIHSNNLVDLYTWLRLIQTLLQYQQQPTPYEITQLMQTWLQLHMNLVRYSSFVNNKAKFKNSEQMVQACQQWMNSSIHTQNPDLYATLQELLLWNDAPMTSAIVDLPEEIERILTKEDGPDQDQNLGDDDDMIDWCTRLSSSDDNNEELYPHSDDIDANDSNTMMMVDGDEEGRAVSPPVLEETQQFDNNPEEEMPILEP